MLGDIGEDGSEGSDAKRSARRNGDPVPPPIVVARRRWLPVWRITS